MNATKRKFNALLSSIGSRNPHNHSGQDSSLQSGSVHDDLLTKKRRVTDSSLIFNRSRSNTSMSDPCFHNKKYSSSIKSPDVISPERPMYAPWDRDEFLRRLKSFSNISHWTPKPARVNEVEWAKRGWVCQKFERVRCCSCSVEIVVKLNKKEKDGKEEPVYVAHAIGKISCLWRKRGCDDSIFRLPLNHPPTTISNLNKRFEELKLCSKDLPYMHNLRTPDDFDFDFIWDNMPKSFITPTPKSEDSMLINVKKVALCMALFGWQAHQHERFGVQPNSVSCHVCFRVLGLWIFKSKEIDQSGEKVLGAAMNCLDVVGEHRAYCPWRNPTSQNGIEDCQLSSSEPMPGWKIVTRILKSEFSSSQNGLTHFPQGRNGDDPLNSGTSAAERKTGKVTRDQKDKEMRSRIMRVRSLFVNNSAKKGPRNVVDKPTSHIKVT
ncbi:putative c3hc zinc finger domain-containing protein [Golovinomyces cichoracearum]|uniref:Putative c3hc zinc finger domain-containing protein n=1 Tax=Golovinomyces cichoracearum TaxID=62708 RepID=A0A420HIQ1_9PEZI|nr:putative c3hc zinc finger domain-containing protein [Golovinomyces cichoracearum]